MLSLALAILLQQQAPPPVAAVRPHRLEAHGDVRPRGMTADADEAIQNPAYEPLQQSR